MPRQEKERQLQSGSTIRMASEFTTDGACLEITKRVGGFCSGGGEGIILFGQGVDARIDFRNLDPRVHFGGMDFPIKGWAVVLRGEGFGDPDNSVSIVSEREINNLGTKIKVIDIEGNNIFFTTLFKGKISFREFFEPHTELHTMIEPIIPADILKAAKKAEEIRMAKQTQHFKK